MKDKTEFNDEIDPSEREEIAETPQPAFIAPRKKIFSVKKLLFTFSVLIGLLIIIWGVIFAYFDVTNKFAIKTVKVLGIYQYVNEKDIQTTLQPFLVGKGLFAFSELQAEKALEQIPGVASASIWRVPPDKIKVIIRERSAVARRQDNLLISSDGVAFPTTSPAGAADLPLLVGNPLYAKQMIEMLQSLPPVFATINATVTGIGLAPNGDWSVQLNNQIWITLGKNDLQDRVRNFLAAYPIMLKSAMPGATLTAVDLRYAHGFTASWSAPTTANSGNTRKTLTTVSSS